MTTFETYAAMNSDQRAEVRNNATIAIYKDAALRGDEVQKACLRRIYISGPDLEVQVAHAKLRGLLEAGIENHGETSRVEYRVAHHLDEVCPPSVPRRSDSGS